MTVGDEIKELDNRTSRSGRKLDQILLSIPNIPHESVPIGENEEDNVEIRKWGEVRQFEFEPKPHWDVAGNLGILDFERAAKVTGSRFVFYKGLGAHLERALISFMLDLQWMNMVMKRCFRLIWLIGQVWSEQDSFQSLRKTAFLIEEEDYFLIPTSEVPVTNYHRDEILRCRSTSN